MRNNLKDKKAPSKFSKHSSFRSSNNSNIKDRDYRTQKTSINKPLPKLEKFSSNVIMGRNCVEEILKYCPDNIIKIYFGSEHGDQRLKNIITEATKLNKKTELADKKQLDHLCSSDSHQNIVAILKDRKFQDLNSFLQQNKDTEKLKLLLLDSIVDPQNFGTILRAAECFGVDAVVWSENRCSPISAVVAKTSVGASEILNLIPVSNLSQAIEKLKQAGFWIYVSTLSEGATSLSEINFDKRSAIVMGSEGFGVQSLIEKNADFKFFIPQFGRIQSLNVSQATAVILYKVMGE